MSKFIELNDIYDERMRDGYIHFFNINDELIKLKCSLSFNSRKNHINVIFTNDEFIIDEKSSYVISKIYEYVEEKDVIIKFKSQNLHVPKKYIEKYPELFIV